MLVCMRTTVRLPDELLEKAKRKAAAEGRTLTSLLERDRVFLSCRAGESLGGERGMVGSGWLFVRLIARGAVPCGHVAGFSGRQAVSQTSRRTWAQLRRARGRVSIVSRVVFA